MPLYPIVDFLRDYQELLDTKRNIERSSLDAQMDCRKEELHKMLQQVQENIVQNGNMEDKIMVSFALVKL